MTWSSSSSSGTDWESSFFESGSLPTRPVRSTRDQHISSSIPRQPVAKANRAMSSSGLCKWARIFKKSPVSKKPCRAFFSGSFFGKTGIRTMRFDSTPRRSARRSSSTSRFTVALAKPGCSRSALRAVFRLGGEVNGLTADDELPGVRIEHALPEPNPYIAPRRNPG